LGVGSNHITSVISMQEQKRDFLIQCLEKDTLKSNSVPHLITLKQKHTPTTYASVIILINKHNYNFTITIFFNCELLTIVVLLLEVFCS